MNKIYFLAICAISFKHSFTIAQSTANTQVSQQYAETYRNYSRRIENLPDIKSPTPPEGEKPIPNSKSTDKVLTGSSYYCIKTEDYSFDTNLKDFILFNPNEDVIWPGALVRFNSVMDGNISLINVSRNPIDIWMNISSSNASLENIKPTALAVNNAKNKLLEQFEKTIAPANLDFEYTEFFSLEQTLIKLGLKASFIGGDVAARLSSKSSVESNIVLAKFHQVYYTINYSLPKGGNQYIFKEGLEDYECNSIFKASNPPCYISSVKYGRMMFFKIESKSSINEINSALNVSKSFLGGNVNADVVFQKFNALKDLKITIIISGGSPTEAVKVISTNDFIKYITSNPIHSKDSPGVPISFVVRDIKNNDLVITKETTKFTKTVLQPLEKIIRITIADVRVHNDGDSGFEGAGDFVWELKVNDKIIAVENNQKNVSTGGTININKTLNLTIPHTVTAEIIISGHITDIDDGLSGSNDRVDFSYATRLTELLSSVYNGKISTSQRRSKNGDPDLEMFFTIEVLGDVDCKN